MTTFSLDSDYFSKKDKKYKNTKKTKKINHHGRPVEVGDGEEGTGPGSSSDKVGRKKSPNYVLF